MDTQPWVEMRRVGMEDGGSGTVVEEVEATINPEAIFFDGHILLRVDRPLAWVGDDTARFGVDLRLGHGWRFGEVFVKDNQKRGKR
jgi:hypothetical protein